MFPLCRRSIWGNYLFSGRRSGMGASVNQSGAILITAAPELWPGLSERFPQSLSNASVSESPIPSAEWEHTHRPTDLMALLVWLRCNQEKIVSQKDWFPRNKGKIRRASRPRIKSEGYRGRSALSCKFRITSILKKKEKNKLKQICVDWRFTLKVFHCVWRFKNSCKSFSRVAFTRQFKYHYMSYIYIITTSQTSHRYITECSCFLTLLCIALCTSKQCHQHELICHFETKIFILLPCFSTTLVLWVQW